VSTYQKSGWAIESLGDPTRRAVFELLRKGPRAVGELARDLPVSRPAVSQHLRVLREAGLVSGERRGNRTLYRIDPGGLEPLRRYVEAVWDDALAAFQQAVEREGGRG
jgi:DNA-binding transcriptional ArsR family regulator